MRTCTYHDNPNAILPIRSSYADCFGFVVLSTQSAFPCGCAHRFCVARDFPVVDRTALTSRHHSAMGRIDCCIVRIGQCQPGMDACFSFPYAASTNCNFGNVSETESLSAILLAVGARLREQNTWMTSGFSRCDSCRPDNRSKSAPPIRRGAIIC